MHEGQIVFFGRLWVSPIRTAITEVFEFVFAGLCVTGDVVLRILAQVYHLDEVVRFLTIVVEPAKPP